MSEMITLLCPEGAYDIPPGHGGRAYLPERLGPLSSSGPTVNNPRDQGGPWVIRVPIEIAHHFLGVGGFSIYEPPPDPPAEEPA
jgi:hypothetical protein